MLFVINGLKYDTDKMELISNKCKWLHKGLWFWGQHEFAYYVDANLYKSIHNRWLITYECGASTYAVAITEKKASNLLKDYDLEKYEQFFGELEEA